MAGRWSDEHIAASLNRMGLPTGQGKTWTAHRVSSVRRVRGIHAYRSAEKDGAWLTMTEAARTAGVTSHTIRRLIKAGILPAVQIVPGAPHQIRANDLASDPVKTAIARKGRPTRLVSLSGPKAGRTRMVLAEGSGRPLRRSLQPTIASSACALTTGPVMESTSSAEVPCVRKEKTLSEHPQRRALLSRFARHEQVGLFRGNDRENPASKIYS